MVARPKRLRRVELATPASSEKMIAKAAASKADYVFMDLEDSVAPREKVASRDKVITALKELDWSGKTRCVRINDLETEWAYEDIIHIVENAHEHLDVIMIPKVKTPADVQFVDTLLSQIERKLKSERRIGLEILIEEVEAMINVEQLARSSPRLEAMIYGVGDFSAAQGIELATVTKLDGYPGDIWHYGRHKITIAARAAGIEAIDGPFGNFNDPATYEEECRRARIIGMSGKWAIHPLQIDSALKVFTPDKAAVDAAREMVAAYGEAEKQGLGAVVHKGEMIDAATVRMVSNLIAKADAIGM